MPTRLIDLFLTNDPVCGRDYAFTSASETYSFIHEGDSDDAANDDVRMMLNILDSDSCLTPLLFVTCCHNAGLLIYYLVSVLRNAN